jgi:hypothetical protein
LAGTLSRATVKVIIHGTINEFFSEPDRCSDYAEALAIAGDRSVMSDWRRFRRI